MKHALGAVIHYMRDNRPHSAPVLARMIVENAHDDWASTPEQVALFTPFGPSRAVYATCDGPIGSGDVFGSREDLVAHLSGEQKTEAT